MESPKITLLSDLDLSKKDFTIKVRIIRLWRRRMNQNGNESCSIEMILLDEQGNKIHAVVYPNFFPKFEKQLQEKVCLIIQKPRIEKNSTTYKYVDSPVKASLNWATTVKKCDSFSGSLYGFSFTGFQPILDRAIAENSTIDVIGKIKTSHDLKEFTSSKGKPTKKLFLYIEDLERRQIPITLWDSYAQQLSDYLKTHKDHSNVVIILQFGRYGSYRGTYSVSNTFNNVSRLFINNEIEDIMMFKKRLTEKSLGETSLSQVGSTSSVFYSLSDDFLIDTQFNNIAKLNECEKIQSVIILGTIKCIVHNALWYYDACDKCTKKVIPKINTNEIADGSTYIEEERIYEHAVKSSCKNEVKTAIKRFKIPIKVEDCTGVVSLIMFDWEAKKILKQTAKELLDKYVEGGCNEIYPDELNSLVGKKFAFKIEVSNYNVEYKYKSFGITKITDDVAILSTLEKNFIDQQDTTSSTGDGETVFPYVGKSTEKSQFVDDQTSQPISTNAGTKRNLDYIYVDDETGSTSTKKPDASIITAEEGDGKKKLKTPKIEK